MAIQLRRGAYADFDPQKMKPAEVAVVQEDDPTSHDGKAIYIAISPGDVKRMAVLDELQDEVYNQIDTAISTATQEAVATATQAAAESASEAAASADAAAESARTLTIDNTLTQAGQAADAKATGDAIAGLNEDLKQIEDEIIETAGAIEEFECELTDEVKAALLACFTHVAWICDGGQTYYNALSEALNRSRVISSISAVFSQGSAVIYDTDKIYALKQYLTVTVTYSDGTTKEVNNYTLSGKLVAGTSTITVAYNRKTTTFNVTVTHQAKTIESISATFSSSAVITTDNVLDDLRPYLTVRATYSDGSTNTIMNYALSGSLNVGTNTITVTYSGKTATFTVNVTQAEKTLQSISTVFNQGSAVIYTTSSLNDLKPYLTVTAMYSDGTTQTVTNYTLSGTLTKGTSTITASYGGKTATFNVSVTEEPVDVSEITDSWDTIIANIDNGTYATKYKIGNYKPIDLGTEGVINIQIVAKDADELADGSGYAALTLLAMKSIVTEKSWNQISSYINSDVKALIPEKIRNRIRPVKKYTVENNNANYLTTENLWIPSAKEINAKSFGFSYETAGVEYDKIFTDNSSRRLSNGAWYWLRSKASINSSNRQYVADGDVGQSAVTATMAIRLGFCLGASLGWESVDFTGMTKTNVSVLKGGTRQRYDYWYIYDNVTCANKTEIKYTVCAYNSSSLDLLGIAFYDSNGTYISGIGVQEADTAQQIEQGGSGDDYLISGSANIPSGATKMAISYHAEVTETTLVFPEIEPLIYLR